MDSLDLLDKLAHQDFQAKMEQSVSLVSLDQMVVLDLWVLQDLKVLGDLMDSVVLQDKTVKMASREPEELQGPLGLLARRGRLEHKDLKGT